MTEYIDRERVLELASHNILDMDYFMVIPSADVAPVVHGKWVKEPVYKQDMHGKMIHFCTKYICSACNHESNTLSSGRFCPNCGAKMDLED